MDKVIAYDLKDNLIRKLAGLVYEEFYLKQKDLSRLAIVFGGKRPSLFLKKELFGLIGKSFLPPAFFSIDEFIEYAMAKKGPFSKVTDLEASFIIFQIAGEIAPEVLKTRETFSKFLPWAREILSFIEQLDLEDIEGVSLKNIQFKADIGYDVPEDINVLLSRIIGLRGRYQEVLKEKKAYSRGLTYLLASQGIRECAFPEFERIFFCGFFYLHKTEERIMKDLYDRNLATLVFQGNDKEWSVLKNVCDAFPFPVAEQAAEKPAQKFFLESGFDVHSQACLVREALGKADKTKSTVIVLPNPGSLIPLLSEISGSLEEFNISMGYPLKRSSLYSLLNCIFGAQVSRKEDKYYAKDYLNVLTHPIIKNLKLLPDYSLTRVLVHKIEEILLGMERATFSGSLFVDLPQVQDSRELYDLAIATAKTMGYEAAWEDLRQALHKMHNILFLSWEKINNFRDFSASLEAFLDLLVRDSTLEHYPLNIKMAEKIFLIKDELNIASFSGEPFPREEIFKIFKNKLENEMVSFSGSPLKGLQVLGLFETRSLNFDNVIIMDMNESSLPSLRIYEPLIPREIMVGLGLNRLEKEEEIQRYQFKRLISQAKEVHLIYQQRSDKERSRFIEELIWEEERRRGSLGVIACPRVSFRLEVLPKKGAVKKSGQIIKFLKEARYSASSINTYLKCPLRFYYQYVLDLRQKEDIFDEPEGSDIGSFIHEFLQRALSQFIGRKPLLGERFRKGFFLALDDKFSAELKKRMRSDSFMVREMLYIAMQRFLDNEEKRGVREVVCLEQEFSSQIKLRSGCYRFKAIVDRIDRLSDGSILVLDYKTGSINILPRSIERIKAGGLSRIMLKETLRSLQLPIYLYFARQDQRFKGCGINAALYSLKNTDKDLGLSRLFDDDVSEDEIERSMQVYLEALDSLLLEITDPAVPFLADEDDKRLCQACPYFYLCR